MQCVSLPLAPLFFLSFISPGKMGLWLTSSRLRGGSKRKYFEESTVASPLFFLFCFCGLYDIVQVKLAKGCHPLTRETNIFERERNVSLSVEYYFVPLCCWAIDPPVGAPTDHHRLCRVRVALVCVRSYALNTTRRQATAGGRWSSPAVVRALQTVRLFLLLFCMWMVTA